MHACVHMLLFGAVVAATMAVTAVAQPTSKPGQPAAEDLAKLAAANNAFALDIFAKVEHPGENEFLSPYSISSALAMTYAGAKGQTAAEMAKALHFELPADRLHAAFRQLTTDLNASGKEGVLLIANALWGQKGFAFKPDYTKLVETEYGGKLTTVDFAKATEEARQTINKWVEEKTREKIKDLIAQGILDPMTRLVLTNAVYFKAPWLEPFNKSQTKKEDFTTAGGKKVVTDMMHQQKHFGYFEGDGFQMLEMAYQGPSASMIVLLPRKADGLAALEKQLDAAKLTEWLSKLSGAKVEVSLPKFRVECKYELTEALKALGMTGVFSSSADFSGMTAVDPLYISAVIHKTFVNVDEEGTEAAAATAVVMRAGAAPKPEEPKIFRADHPFLFLVRDRKSGTILFLGRLMKPGEAQSSKARRPATPAQEVAAKVGLANLETALDTFEVDCGRFPSTAEGLHALLERPANLAGWHGPYVNKVPKDPWGHEFIYRCPGLRNEQAYDLSSLGADGQEGNDDITN